jgi:hypothetical protein
MNQRQGGERYGGYRARDHIRVPGWPRRAETPNHCILLSSRPFGSYY